MRTVIVTGASSGIGRAVADRLHADGWSVTGLSRSGRGGSGWQPGVADVDDDASIARAIAGVAGETGRLDAIVTAAGWGLAGPAEETPVVDAKAQFETNFWGTVRSVQCALPYLRRSHGRAVLLGSVAGVIGIPFQSHYSATKFALEGWAESLAWEVEPLGVRVTIVQPGNFRTGFTAARRSVDVSEGSPYADSARRAVDQMERDERGGADPAQAAAAVVRVLTMRRPPLRVTVGPVGERAGTWAKRLLPYRAFERLARGSLLGE
jgi:NAD(P)-dependent dehydrogenase (short-subunit alcohol dehydrogenase family)